MILSTVFDSIILAEKLKKEIDIRIPKITDDAPLYSRYNWSAINNFGILGAQISIS